MSAFLARARALAAAVPDPELPFVTIGDLGILRAVEFDGDRVVVSITPTYSGCPAMREIHQDVQRRLGAAGFDAQVRVVLQPPWTTDWITDAGRRKLATAGIAAPHGAARGTGGGRVPLTLAPRAPQVVCPQCGSSQTELVSRFSATACQALYRCRACAEPFNYVKEI